jgi:hypothetical protein
MGNLLQLAQQVEKPERGVAEIGRLQHSVMSRQMCVNEMSDMLERDDLVAIALSLMPISKRDNAHT